MDVVRLAIVYDTNQAADRLRRLNGQLTSTNGSTMKLASAAVGLAQAMGTGSISATGLTNKLATLGGKLGLIGIGIAVATGALLLFKRNTDKARDAATKFADQMRQTRRSVDELLRSDIRSPMQTEIERITDAVRELDRELTKQRSGGIWNLLKGAAGGITNVPGNLWNLGKRLWLGGEKDETRRQREGLAGELNRLTPQNLAQSMNLQSLASQNRISQFTTLARGLRSEELSGKVRLLEEQLSKLLEILPENSDEVQTTARSLVEYTDALRRAQRAEHLLTSGLETMADALEDFVVTGTLAFTDFLNNILRLLYRDFTGELVHGIVRGAVGGSGPTGVGTGDVKDIAGVPKSGISPSVQSNVNFTIQTMDAQGVAQWVNTNKGLIAAAVTEQMGRSASLRRVVRRG